jgi:hypothetical protein
MKKKKEFTSFKTKDDAQSFLNEAYDQARKIANKYERKLFWLELKISIKFRMARILLGKQKQESTPYSEGRTHVSFINYGAIGDVAYKRPVFVKP